MIYIQSNKERTLPHHFDCACAMYGAMDSGIDFRLTSYEEIMEKPMIWNSSIMKNNLFVGSVEFMREVFKRAGLNPHSIRVPMNSDRPHLTYNLKEVKEIVATGKKLFIKPLEIKLFTGFVLDQCKYPCLNNVPDDALLMVYDPFESKILSEWRIYVHNHKIIDARNYSGDFKITPYYRWVEHRIYDNKETFPVSYTIDVGILDRHPKSQLYLMMSERNVIVEYNDMWAIGNYGMSNDLYLKLLTDRYFEIMRF